MNLESKRDVARIIVKIREEGRSESAAGAAFVNMIWSLHDLAKDVDLDDVDLTDEEVDLVLQELPTSYEREQEADAVPEPPELEEQLLEEAFDLRRKGVSYSAIARVMEDKPNGPDEISRETIRRYCEEADVAPA